jgi:hypothetical protein
MAKIQILFKIYFYFYINIKNNELKKKGMKIIIRKIITVKYINSVTIN